MAIYTNQGSLNMEQVSDVTFRAEKMYKNTRGKFGYVLREIIANAIHSTIIRQNTEENNEYQPFVDIFIDRTKDNIKIIVKDNGIGFTEENRKYFSQLDYQNQDKIQYNFFPQGQGRLAIIYFTDGADYKSVCKEKNGDVKEINFFYPQRTNELFDDGKMSVVPTESTELKTIVTLNIRDKDKLKRANTFFDNHSNCEKLRDWIIDNFLSFFMEFENLSININYAAETFTIQRAALVADFVKKDFTISFKQEDIPHTFNIWIIKNTDSKNNKKVLCYARYLQVELETNVLEYDIDLQDNTYWIITSDYFDLYVNSKGDKIEIPAIDAIAIQNKLNETLDKYYENQIKENKKRTATNMKSTIKKYGSLRCFIDTKDTPERKVLKSSDIINRAIDEKGKIEKRYWQSDGKETEESNKLINSSLHVYIEHRRRVLEQFHEMLKKFNKEGEENKHKEEEIHNLILKRGTKLSDTDNINHLHNLWLLDDKFTIFSETIKGLSSRQGEAKSDIYLWTDNPEKVNELLILELKSPTAAHNAGKAMAGMITQVKNYACAFYNNPEKIVGSAIDPQKVLYTGIIIAKTTDIYNELSSNNTTGNYTKIPFLDNSYVFNETFVTRKNKTSAPETYGIRIELYSYEDIYKLASNRNNVFIKLLNNEYSINEDVEVT
ncbi:MAG: ATP-binding protein [Treponema sp.]